MRRLTAPAAPAAAAGTQPPAPITCTGAPCGSCARSPSPRPAPMPRRFPRPPGPAGRCCAAACGAPTAASSRARCRPRGTVRCSSACCTPTPPSWSSSRPAPAAPTASSSSTGAAAPSTSCPAAPAATGAGSTRLLEHAERIVAGALRRAGDGTASRARRRSSASRRASGAAATSTRSPQTRFLWVDVDRPDRLAALWELLAERPCHLLIESGGSGGAHAYWKLDEPLPATRVEPGRASDRADRARAPADHPRARRRRRTAGPTSPTRAARNARG